MNRRITLIGAPTDIGAGSRGASMGPEALRVADIGPVLVSHGLEVIDRGNLAGPPNPWQAPLEGYRHLAEVVAWNQAVHDAVHAELGQVAVALERGLPGVGRTGKVAPVDHLEAVADQYRADVGDPQRLGAHARAAAAGADVGRGADQGDAGIHRAAALRGRLGAWPCRTRAARSRIPIRVRPMLPRRFRRSGTGRGRVR